MKSYKKNQILDVPKKCSMTSLKRKYLWYIYGAEILEALLLDDILRNCRDKRKQGYVLKGIFDQEDENLRLNLSYLVREKYIVTAPTGYCDGGSYYYHHYYITQKGLLHLAHGGFTIEAKKSKNALFSFRISLVAITISIITFLVSLFNWFK